LEVFQDDCAIADPLEISLDGLLERCVDGESVRDEVIRLELDGCFFYRRVDRAD
jgi:hypothetical protein